MRKCQSRHVLQTFLQAAVGCPATFSSSSGERKGVFNKQLTHIFKPQEDSDLLATNSFRREKQPCKFKAETVTNLR